jgi:hypothetical protein
VHHARTVKKAAPRTLWLFGNLTDFLTTAVRHDVTFLLTIYVTFNTCSFLYRYKAIQDESPTAWEVTFSLIVRKNVRTNTCLVLTGYRDTAVRIHKYKSIVDDNKEREITYCWFYCYCKLCKLNNFNDKSVTVRNKCPKIPSSTPMHFCNSRAKIAFCS